MTNIFKFKTELWLYSSSKSAWHFVTLPKNTSLKIKKIFLGLERGFGSLPVLASIGKTEWKTSIFPDKKAGAYLLPVKNLVRKQEGLKAGNKILVKIAILV